MEDNKTMEEEIQTNKQVSKQATSTDRSKQHDVQLSPRSFFQMVGWKKIEWERRSGGGVLKEKKRSRGIRVWTNHQSGHRVPQGGVGRGGKGWGDPPPPSLVGAHHATRGTK